MVDYGWEMGKNDLSSGKKMVIEWRLVVAKEKCLYQSLDETDSTFSATWTAHLGNASVEKCIIIVVTQVIRLPRSDLFY